MPIQNDIHFYLNWAKERLDEMDAILTALVDKAGEVEAGVQAKAKQTLADLEKKRDAFSEVIKKQSQANEASWVRTKTQLESEWNAFEKVVKSYIDEFGDKVEQQKATFVLQSEAQLRAWKETADQFADAAKTFKKDRRAEIDAALERLKADADVARQRLEKLAQAGDESWSALTAALGETRASFDRANQTARDAFKRANA